MVLSFGTAKVPLELTHGQIGGGRAGGDWLSETGRHHRHCVAHPRRAQLLVGQVRVEAIQTEAGRSAARGGRIRSRCAADGDGICRGGGMMRNRSVFTSTGHWFYC